MKEFVLTNMLLFWMNSTKYQCMHYINVHDMLFCTHIYMMVFIYLFILTGGWLLYNIVVVFAIHWRASAICTHIYTWFFFNRFFFFFIYSEVGKVVCYSHLFKNFPVCCDPHSQSLHRSQWSRSRCFSGTLLLFRWSNGCWQFDLWFLCLF